MTHLPRIDAVQVTDLHGDTIIRANGGALISGTGTTTVFTGIGVFLGVAVWVSVDAGTMYFTDASDALIVPLPTVTIKALTDFAGSMPACGLVLTNGLKIVTADATGLVMSAFTFEPDA